MTDHRLTAADITDGSVNNSKITKAGKIVGIALLVLTIMAIASGGMFVGKMLFSTHTVQTVEVVTSVPKVCERALNYAEKSHETWEQMEQYKKAAQLATSDYQDAWAAGDTKLMAKLLQEGNDAGLARDTAEYAELGYWNKYREAAQQCRQKADEAPTRQDTLTSRD